MFCQFKASPGAVRPFLATPLKHNLLFLDAFRFNLKHPRYKWENCCDMVTAQRKQRVQHRVKHQRRKLSHITTKLSLNTRQFNSTYNRWIKINKHLMEVMALIDYSHLIEADVSQYVAFLLCAILFYSDFCSKWRVRQNLQCVWDFPLSACKLRRYGEFNIQCSFKSSLYTLYMHLKSLYGNNLLMLKVECDITNLIS